MKTGKAILAVLTGLAAGAALGVLFSPDNGRKAQEVRPKDAEALAKLLDKLNEKFAELEARTTTSVKS